MKVRIGCSYNNKTNNNYSITTNNNNNNNNNIWFTILLLFGTNIISVSPNSSTTIITTFQKSYVPSSSIITTTNSIRENFFQDFMEKKSTIMNRGYQSVTELNTIGNIQTHHIKLTNNSIVKKIENSNKMNSVKKRKFDFFKFPRRTKFWKEKKIRIRRNGEPLVLSGEPDPCYQFAVGDPEAKTFHSPGYPDNYPKKINCTKKIEAPEGQRVRLDFLDSFKIEDKEDCKFDYLEIRNGPYGFSNLIGTYCGENFPDVITSDERHLWLFFHSDESIEYSGFTGVYEFISRPPELRSTDLNCIIELNGYEGWINRTQIPEYVSNNVTKYHMPLDCMWIITVAEGWKIQTKFSEFHLDKPNDCQLNFIDFFNEETTMGKRLKNFCGSAGEALQSENNKMHIRFYAEHGQVEKSRFEVLYTAFREKKEGCDDETEFDCEDNTCISKELRCNSMINCKFSADEENCEEIGSSLSEHVVIIIIIFGLILGGMISTFLFNCIRKLVRDQKIIREHIRQSKESKLDEMGRSSAKRSDPNLSIKLSPREKHSQTSLQILDDVSNRFYRDIVPISVQPTHVDIKSSDGFIAPEPILRQHHDMVVQTSLCDGSSSSVPPDNGLSIGGNMCDTGCQTRESLFQTPSIAQLVRQKSLASSSPNQSQSAIRFSTFGYDQQQIPTKSKSLSRQSSAHQQQSIEMEELHGQRLPETSLCQHHHQHQMHHLQQLQKQQQANTMPHHHIQQQQQPGSGNHYHQTLIGSGSGVGKSSKQKSDDSKNLIDIRNSAPDVIIMTSH